MKRRMLLIVGAGSMLAARGQVMDMNEAINKAGRQRMLSQRMGKAYLALVQGVEPGSAQQVLDKSMALFDRQLVELKAFAPNPDIRDTYGKLDAAWGDYKTALVGAAPSKAGAAQVITLDGRMLALANQGTSQYEAASGKPSGRLVNIAGRQRMLSQRMAKYYFAAGLRVDATTAVTELNKARTDFMAAMDTLRNAPEATSRIRDELQLADAQWMFFDQALQKMQTGTPAARPASDVFVTSENLLSVMDRVTGLFSALKA
jgi:nitrate/nitrite-specific signal transduction histidine kinase